VFRKNWCQRKLQTFAIDVAIQGRAESAVQCVAGCGKSVRRVRSFFLAILRRSLTCSAVTDMLAAALNICTQEELMESSQGSTAPSAAPADRDLAEKRKVIKNKILAVGRMAHFFSLLRCVMLRLLVGYRLTVLTIRSEESERGSKFKSTSGSSRLAYSTLTLGAEGIKNAIKTFDDACAPFYLFYVYCTVQTESEFCRRKSDIENERLPPVDERQPASASSSIPTNLSPSVNIAPRANPVTVVPTVMSTFKRPRDGKLHR
jgi:hypothetical protein